MLFTEPTFLFAFLPLVLVLHAAPWPRWRNALLLTASLAFYAWGATAHTTVAVGLVVVNYGAARLVDRLRGTAPAWWVLCGVVAVDLVVLATFKYAAFIVSALNAVAARLGGPALAVPDIALPIGISFLTFHAISYVVDVYRGDAAAQKGPLATALYLLLFPQLIAGPIIRYRDIAAQLAVRRVAVDDVAAGLVRFSIGLAKKMLIANTVAGPADAIFALPANELTSSLAWLGITCYTLQIYFDFSGYSDMAIGLGRMFGFRFPENFRYPYAATSVRDFWRRWHVSLSSWFRDYVYVPLGGNRTTPTRVYANLVLVFALCGLWHGASWSFVAWGLFHGAFLVIERLLADVRSSTRATPAWPAAALGRVYTLLVVMVGWVLFRADSLADAGTVLAAMAGGRGTAGVYDAAWYLTPEVWCALVAGVIGSLPVVPWVRRRWIDLTAEVTTTSIGVGTSTAVAVVAIALLSVSAMLSAAGTYSPFIYFRF